MSNFFDALHKVINEENDNTYYKNKKRIKRRGLFMEAPIMLNQIEAIEQHGQFLSQIPEVDHIGFSYFFLKEIHLFNLSLVKNYQFSHELIIRKREIDKLIAIANKYYATIELIHDEETISLQQMVKNHIRKLENYKSLQGIDIPEKLSAYLIVDYRKYSKQNIKKWLINQCQEYNLKGYVKKVKKLIDKL